MKAIKKHRYIANYSDKLIWIGVTQIYQATEYLQSLKERETLLTICIYIICTNIIEKHFG